MELNRDGALRAVAPLPARAALGTTMIYHGLDKIRGEGPKQTAQFFESVGLRPAKPLAIATGVAELGAGILALAGIGTRIAALAVLATQAGAIAKVHGKRGFAVSEGGFEYNVALMAMALGLLLGGPDRLSAKELVSRRSRPPRWMFWAKPQTPRALRWLQ